jgi:hypothetical protein
MLNASAEDARVMLIESSLAFCEMTRLCGDSEDLLFALAKTGFLEEKFSGSIHSTEIYPAVLKERAEILWKRNETIEAIQTLRALIGFRSTASRSFTLISEEIVLAKLVQIISSTLTGRLLGPLKCGSVLQRKS